MLEVVKTTVISALRDQATQGELWQGQLIRDAFLHG